MPQDESPLDAPVGERRALWLAIAATGVLSGALSLAFRFGLNEALELREGLGASLQPFGLAGALALAAVCAASVACAVWMTQRFAPEAAGSGIPHVEGVARGLLEMWPKRVVGVKFVAGILGIGGGLMLGREGPTVQMAASLSYRLGSSLGLSQVSRRILLAVGAGSGLTGAFNAPLAGTLFVAEELRSPFRTQIYLGTLLAAAVTDVFLRAAGEHVELRTPGVVPAELAGLVPALAIGILAGVAGALFNAGVLRALDAAAAWRRRWPGWWLGLGLGALLGGIAWLLPEFPGGGVIYASLILDGRVTAGEAAWLFPASAALTVASYAVGAPGGLFAPLLVSGAALGLSCHGAWLSLDPGTLVPPALFTATGMAALFAAVVRSPFTGTVLLVEMTGSDALALPLVIASLVGHFVAEGLGSAPIYESLLERELRSRLAE